MNKTTMKAVCLLAAALLFLAGIAQAETGALPAGDYTALRQLDRKSIGVQTGTNFDTMIPGILPKAKIEYFNDKADLVAALASGKIEGFVMDEPVVQYVMKENDDVTYIPEYLDTYQFAFVFPRTEGGEALRSQFNEFLAGLRKAGRLDTLKEKWFAEDEAEKSMPDYAAFPAGNGVLRLATAAGYAPFEYVRGNGIVGYDMEIAALFCEAYGYGLEIVDMNFDGILPSIQSGKCEFAGAGIAITPERAESVLFSDASFTGGTVMAVRKAGYRPTGPFWDNVRRSFEKTFLREDRWKLFAQGIGATLLITVLSILLGTAVGFGVFLLCRKGNIAANGITRFSIWLVQGMPVVVLLMILYYIVFGAVAISSILVAVVGFTLTFGASVFGLLKMGVSAVDPGQYEAACALGHTERRTFFRIILPQAVPRILPAYQSEIIGLIKATAIVGYIAIQDLTKVGDIVRSRTYDAFFPLISITVIYFGLEALFGFAVSRIRVGIDPKKRTRERILKGVKTDD